MTEPGHNQLYEVHYRGHVVKFCATQLLAQEFVENNYKPEDKDWEIVEVTHEKKRTIVKVVERGPRKP